MKRPEESNGHRRVSLNPIAGARYDEGRLHRKRLSSESCRDVAIRILFFVILFIILFAVAEHHRQQGNSCEDGQRPRVVAVSRVGVGAVCE